MLAFRFVLLRASFFSTEFTDGDSNHPLRSLVCGTLVSHSSHAIHSFEPCGVQIHEHGRREEEERGRYAPARGRTPGTHSLFFASTHSLTRPRCCPLVRPGRLCKTGFGTPGDSNFKKCWTTVFARPQPDQKNNPKKALYGADWNAAVKAYPELKKIGKSAHSKVKSFWGKKLNVKKMNLRIPFTRACVPSSYGLKSCGLTPGMVSARVNPNGYETDATSKVFIKMFYDSKSGKFVSGQTGH